MDFKSLLNQVMASGNELASQAGRQMGDGQGGMSDMTKGAIGGAVGGSLVTLLVGSKKGRKMAKKTAKLGGAAALGALAYKVYNDWQAQQPPEAQVAPAPAAPEDTPQHSMAVLRAMLAAARADGHIDDAERGRIYKAVESLGATAEVSAFVDRELARPLSPATVAAGVNCPEQAAEIYLASVLMVDEQSFMERAYLDELARELALQPELVQRLEAQAAD